MAGRSVSVVLFGGFELLDAFGPVQLFSVLPDEFEVTFLGPSTAPVASAQGVTVNPTHAYKGAPDADIVLVPGGGGTRLLASDNDFCTWLHDYASTCGIVASVCTGSGLLAAAGLLDGYRATSNKRAFSWAAAQGDDVTWVRRARWVVDGNQWTSSGVAAGMDMTAALIADLCGPDVARHATDLIELDVQRDPTHDRFADLYDAD